MGTSPSGYTTPKTNWAAGNIPAASDFNRIEGNIQAIEEGQRTIDPAQTPSGNSGTLRQLLDWFANRIKAILGTTNWYDTPPTTLQAAKTHIDRTDNPHNVTIAQIGAAPASHTHPNATTNTAGFMSAADKSKLDGIENGATADMTAEEILTALKGVDGSGSGLDADLLDGKDSSYYATNAQVRDVVQIDKSITLAAANWADDTTTSGYWIYDVTDSEVTEDTIVDVYIQRASMQTALDAGVQPFCESSAGSYRLFAESQPSSDIIIDVKKTRQVVS